MFFFDVRDRARHKMKRDDRELITVLETVCADGTAPVLPTFVFQGKLFCEEWAKEHPEIMLATTDSGWTNEEIFCAWMEDVFVPQAKEHSDPDYPILLI
ncbi:hypothetical protein GYMLUDRAFT_167394, partial [Collybiopsis luxurians FD-317 M1]